MRGRHCWSTARTATRKSLRAQLDVLIMAWGNDAVIGWDGVWWFRRQDGRGQRTEASTPEELSRLLGDEFRFLPPALGLPEGLEQW